MLKRNINPTRNSSTHPVLHPPLTEASSNNLNAILKNKKIENCGSEDECKQIVAAAVDEYLQTHAVISSLQIQRALEELTFHSQAIRNNRRITNGWSVASQNKYLGGLDIKSRPLTSAIEFVFAIDHPGKKMRVNYTSGSHHHIAKYLIYYKDETKLAEFVRKHISLEHLNQEVTEIIFTAPRELTE